MRQKSNSTPASSETLVRNIRRATRKHHPYSKNPALCSMVCTARTSITKLFQRQSHHQEHVLLLVKGVLWRPASAGSLATRHGLQQPMRSSGSGPRPGLEGGCGRSRRSNCGCSKKA